MLKILIMSYALSFWETQFLGNWVHAKSRSVIPALAGVHGLHYDCKYISLGMLIVFPRIQMNWIHPLTCFFASLACHRLLSASFLVLGGPACPPKSKGCKPRLNLVQTKMHGLHGHGFHVIEKGSMWTYVNLDVPSVYGTGCAISDFTKCIPVPWGGPGAHLSGLKKVSLGCSILSKSVFWPVLPQPCNLSEASGQAHTWLTCPSTHVVHGASAYAEIRQKNSDVWCAKDDPIYHFSIN
jgi:hypothetical protein